MVKNCMQDSTRMTEKILVVQLRGGPPWGFRLKGGRGGGGGELYISTVNSKGRQQGVKEGDRLLAIDERSAAEMTHAEAQTALKESSGTVELHVQRRVSTAASGMNGENGVKNCDLSQSSSCEDDIVHSHSWSTDSTSTGSTIVHVSPNSSEEQSSGTERVWSPSGIRKKTNLKLNCDLQGETVERSKETRVQSCTTTTSTTTATKVESHQQVREEEESSPVWQPFGALYEGPQFRPVKLEVKTARTATPQPEEAKRTATPDNSTTAMVSADKESTNSEEKSSTITGTTTTTTTSPTFVKSGWGSHLPPSQSPTITLLQKAREGQLPKGAIYLDDRPDSTPLPKNAVLIDQKVTVEGDKLHTDSFYAVPTTLSTETTTHTIKAPDKYDGIGPTEYGIPVGLRTGIKEEYASDWYKTMYKSLHRPKFPNEPSHAVHFGGYMSEPEFDRKDAYYLQKYATTDHRRKPFEKHVSYSTEANGDKTKKSVGVESSVVKHEPQKYKVEPRSIADYEPGRSSLAEKEFEKFWSDFWDSMDDLHEHLGDVSPRPRHQQLTLNRRWANVLLSDGYQSDSTLIRKTGHNPHVDPEQQKAWYKEIQKGGEIPFIGLRKSAPEKPAASPHQYQETEVNIHYRSPIRHLEKEYIEEEELKRRQEDAMRKFYEEEKKKKHQQELAEIEMRRHSDYFTPSQKSPIPLNRYENPFEMSYGNRLAPPGMHRGPPPKTMARVLYPFTAQTNRELSLNKGDIVYIARLIDRNWYEGEHHGLMGIFPVSYVEIIPCERANMQPRKATEGEAIVKYNFRAQTPIELSLFKGERVVLTRRMDQNWYEGRLGTKKGIFPVSYVNVHQEPGEFNLGSRAISPKPPASPVYSPIVNGSPPKVEGPTFNTGQYRPLQNKPPLNLDTKSSLTQSLHIDTYNEPIPYRSLYSYKPQNDDELELQEGDTVYVMEKCDDGWYVGTSLRSGLFGTFPGNYVERI